MTTYANSARTFGPLSYVLALGLSVSLAGCGADSATPLEASVDEKVEGKPVEKKPQEVKPAETPAVAKPNRPARPIEELTNAIEVALTDSASTSRSDRNRDAVARVAALRRQIGLGVEAASDLITQHQEVHEAVAKAWRARLTLLYRGAREELDEFAEQLDEAAVEAAATQYQEEAEYGSGLVFGIRQLNSDKPVHEVVAELTRHTKTFPNGKSSARLFLAYAKELVEKNQKADASSVCQAALWQLHEHPELRHIRSYIDQMEKGEIRRVATQKRDIIQKMIENQVAQEKNSLPLQIDQLTILYEIEAEYRMIIYKYRVALELDEFRTEQRTIEEEVSRKARSSAITKKMLDKGIRLKYVYFGKDGKPFHDFIVQKR
jgi:hypothetical protein